MAQTRHVRKSGASQLGQPTPNRVIAEYDFAADETSETSWAPYVSYRFAYFSGDDQSGDNDNRFDPLYYTFNDWNEWFIGEIVGEWVAGNSNINANIGTSKAPGFIARENARRFVKEKLGAFVSMAEQTWTGIAATVNKPRTVVSL